MNFFSNRGYYSFFLLASPSFLDFVVVFKVFNLIFFGVDEWRFVVWFGTGIVHSEFRPCRVLGVSQIKIPVICTTMSATPVFDALSDDTLSALSENSRACIERFCKYEAASEPERSELLLNPNQYVNHCGFFGPMPPNHVPQSPPCCVTHRHVLAAVLVLLYERPGGRGGLRVLLTTRSKELRSHPGQTALPGGKVDKSDAGVVETAVSFYSSKLPPHLHTYFIIAPCERRKIDRSEFFFFGLICTVQGSKRGSRFSVTLSARPYALHTRAIRLTE